MKILMGLVGFLMGAWLMGTIQMARLQDRVDREQRHRVAIEACWANLNYDRDDLPQCIRDYMEMRGWTRGK